MREILSAIRRSQAEATLGGIVAIAFMVCAVALVLLTGRTEAVAFGGLGFIPFLIGATNEIRDEGDFINAVLTNPASGGTSGAPARLGGLGGVLVMAQASDGTATLALRGVYDLSVKAIDDTGNVAVAKGDSIYYVDADTPKLSKKASGYFFGYALATITSGSTATINVLLAKAGATGSAQISAGSITPSKLGLLARNATGGTLTQDTIVTVNGYDATTGLPKLVKADADAAAPAMGLWVCPTDIANNTNEVVVKSILSAATLNVGGAVGDEVFLDTTAGGWTLTAPTTSASRVQRIGFVVVVSATVGQILWMIDQPPRRLGHQDLQAAIDINTTGSLKHSGATAGIGYATGAGGAVTQITSRSTGVTLNKLSGAITTDTTSLAAEASAVFVVTNSTVEIGDTVIVSIRSGQNGGNTIVQVDAVAAGSFSIRVLNQNAAAGAAETGAIVINFAVIKAVSA